MSKVTPFSNLELQKRLDELEALVLQLGNKIEVLADEITDLHRQLDGFIAPEPGGRPARYSPNAWGLRRKLVDIPLLSTTELELEPFKDISDEGV